MIKALEYILTRFPDQRAKIINLYNTDDDFKTLCEDYFTSVQALDKCRTSATKGREVENEYLHVNLELEKEDPAFIQNVPKRNSIYVPYLGAT